MPSSSQSNGIHSARYQRDRASKKKHWKAAHRRCALCQQDIDYDLPQEDPMHFQLDHIKSRKRFPELEFDPTNWQPAHARCNKGKSEGAMTLSIGMTSEIW